MAFQAPWFGKRLCQSLWSLKCFCKSSSKTNESAHWEATDRYGATSVHVWNELPPEPSCCVSLFKTRFSVINKNWSYQNQCQKKTSISIKRYAGFSTQNLLSVRFFTDFNPTTSLSKFSMGIILDIYPTSTRYMMFWCFLCRLLDVPQCELLFHRPLGSVPDMHPDPDQ